MLTAISPIDGRYHTKTAALADYFSEYALIKYRVRVEALYFVALCRLPLPQLAGVSAQQQEAVLGLAEGFSLADAERVKAIEQVTNHDVKAVEYFLKEAFDGMGLEAYREFVHFGLTSQDINNTATPMLLKAAIQQQYEPQLAGIQQVLDGMGGVWAEVPMLARTHGQPASPTRLGKELRVFARRIELQMGQLQALPHCAKFGGATGNLNAHVVTYPHIDWAGFADDFVAKDLHLVRSQPTTQIEHYDNMAAQFQAMMRINTILIDLCRDIWAYISMDYFKQRVVAGEVGSSAMPHKVNPIDFENAEGNLGLANALFAHLADKLPISRLQRDLTDSTVLRNIGVPMGHTIIAFQSIKKGLGKLLLNEEKLQRDLADNWMVVAEGIQSILRREGYPEPYEALKSLTRGQGAIGQAEMHAFVDGLAVSEAVKAELKQISPFNYLGV